MHSFSSQGIKSFRALQSQDPSDDRQWLTFWLLFSLFVWQAPVEEVVFTR